MIYHVALAADWDAALAAGTYRVSTVGLSLEQVGFVHAAFAEQLDGVLRRHHDRTPGELVLLAVDEGGLDSPVVVEPAPGTGAAFPHVYGPIPVEAVRSVVPLARDDDGHVLAPPLGGIAP